MLDIEEQLRRYAEAAEAAVPRSNTSTRKRPSRLLAAAAVIVLAAVGAVVAAQQGDDRPITADSTGTQVLPVPDAGAAPEQLADGTPVWVVRHDDGTVSVLDATSTHRPFGVGRLVGWCADSRYLLDPAHGSIYDDHGAKLAGPAPTGLALYPVEETEGDRVTISTPPVRQGLSSDPHSGSATCFTDLTLHDSEAWPAEDVRSASELVRVDDAVLLLRAGQASVLCEDGLAYSNPPTCSGVPAPELSLTGDAAWATIRGDIIARAGAGGVVDITLIGDAILDTSDAQRSPPALSDRLLTPDDVRAIVPSIVVQLVAGRDYSVLGPEEMTGITRGGIQGVSRMWGDESVTVPPETEAEPQLLNLVATVIEFPTYADAMEAADRITSQFLNEGGRPVTAAPGGYTVLTGVDAAPAQTWLAVKAESERLVGLQARGFGDQTETFLRLLDALHARTQG